MHFAVERKQTGGFVAPAKPPVPLSASIAVHASEGRVRLVPPFGNEGRRIVAVAGHLEPRPGRALGDFREQLEPTLHFRLHELLSSGFVGQLDGLPPNFPSRDESRSTRSAGYFQLFRVLLEAHARTEKSPRRAAGVV